jgi:RHS repeat-associated protein
MKHTGNSMKILRILLLSLSFVLFSAVVHAQAVGGTITRSNTVEVCNQTSGTLTLSGHTGTIRWQRWESPETGWVNIFPTNSTTVLNYSVSVLTQFRARLTEGSSTAYSNQALIEPVSASSGGTISGGGTFTSSAAGTLTLSNFFGNIERWEKSVNGSTWTNIANTTTTQAFNVTQTTYFRASVKFADCSAAYSSVATITIVPPVPTCAGGTLSSAAPAACSLVTGTLTLSNYTGAIIQWEKSEGGGAWVPIANTANTLNYSLTMTTAYRVLVSDGSCSSYSSTRTVTVYAIPYAGPIWGITESGYTMNDLNYCKRAFNVDLFYDEFEGSIVQWEQSDNGGSWSTIDHTAKFFETSNLHTPIVRQYRVLVQGVGGCRAYSQVKTINVAAETIGGSIAGSSCFNTTASGTLTLTGYIGSVLNWEASTDGGVTWNNIGNNGLAALAYSGVTVTTRYRAVIRSGVCDIVRSSEATVTKDSPPGTPPTPYGPLTVIQGSTDDYYAYTPNARSYTWTLSPSQAGVITSSGTVTWNPGYFGPATITVVANGCQTSSPPSSVVVNVICNCNYIRETTVLVTGKTNTTQLPSLPVTEKNEKISYFDGLGQPMQEVLWQASATSSTSPTVSDIVQPLVYNEFGLEQKKYLPYVNAENTGWFKPSPVKNGSGYSGSPHQLYYANGTADKVQDDANPYAETRFEPTPLNRVLEQGAPGEAWLPDATDSYTSVDRTIKKAYEYNKANEVMLWTYVPPTTTYPLGLLSVTSGATPTTPNYYGSNQLFRNKTKDEQHHEVIEYTDKAGRVVLKRVQAIDAATKVDSINYASTYYIYDDRGNLMCVLPPEATKLIASYYQSGSTDATRNDFLNRWAFRYTYDYRGRMAQKKMPGAEPVYMVYDDRDRLVLSQDGNQRSTATKHWTFTKYDLLNRPIVTGIKDTVVLLTQPAMQEVVNAFYASMATKPWRSWGEKYEGNAVGKPHGYSNASYPVVTTGAILDVNKYLTVTYYDNYDFHSQWPGAYEYFNDALNQPVNGVTYSQPAAASAFVTGQITGIKTKVLDGGVTGGYTWLKSVNYYDDKYRVIQVISDNYKGGTDRVSNLYDFPGKILKSKETHVEYDPAWQNMANIIRSGNKLIATTSTWGNAGAASFQTLAAGQNGWVECLASETTTGRIFGLSDTNPDLGYASIRYGFQQSPSGLYVIESGTQTLLSATFNPGEILTIERVGSVINYRRNGSTVKSTTGALTTQLFIDVAMNNINSTLVGLRSSFSTSSKSVVRTFTYDHAGRLKETWHQVDSGPAVLLSKNEYNELGQLIDKKLHSTVAAATDAKQSVDYRYNIRGWLTSMNNSQLSNDGTTNDDTGDYFGMNLGYNADIGISNAAMFNGNISGIKWSNNLGTGTIKEKAYTYSYDAMNRIAGSTFKENTTAWAALGNSGFAESGFSYDLNGNILSLTRNDKRSSGTMDILQYNYGTSADQSNKLLYVMDNGDDHAGFRDGNPGTSADYNYDANGNMVIDNNKGLDLITYNYLNLPENVTKTGSTIHYIYDASGRKLMQEVISGSQTKQTEYAGAFTYEDDVLQFISHEEGRVVMTEGPKLLYTNAGDNVTGIGPNGATAALTTLNGGQTYIEVSHGGSAQRSGIYPINGILTVQAGERYLVRAKGYRTGNTAVNFQIRVNNVDQGVGAALPFGAAAECYIEQLVTIPVGGTDLRVGLIWIPLASGEKFYVNDFEIYKLGISSMPEYQYNLKDHLGNVRLTFTTKNETETSLATLETANASSEQGKFLYYNEAIKVNHPPFDHTNAGTTYYSTRLTGGSTNAKYGLTKTLSIMPGDVVNMEVYAKYLDPTSTNWTAALNSFITAINGGTAPAGTIVDGGAAGSIGGGTYPISPINHAAETGTPPKAYLNYIVFDRAMATVLDVGYSRITANSREYGQDGAHDRLALNYTAKEPGYIYIYISNENPTAVEVYFDDFKVEHVKSPVVQVDDYYPFGLTYNSYQRENSVANSIKFQGQEHIDDLDLGWDSFRWRNHQPEIGRFFNIDPLAEKYVHNSPYAFSENRVVNAIELEGLEALMVNYHGHWIERTRTATGGQVTSATSAVYTSHPIITTSVGMVEPGSTNISSVSGRIARHLSEGGNMTTNDGSEQNAFRHALWSATITQQFGGEIATQVTNAHEGIGPFEPVNIDFSKGLVQKTGLADGVVDILNNAIGRDLADGFSGNESAKDIATAVLNYQKNEGLWTVKIDKDGNVSISRSKITQKQFDKAMGKLSTLDNNGFNDADRKNLEERK